MRKIKDLTVTVTYTVALCSEDVADNVLSELQTAYLGSRSIGSWDTDTSCIAAHEWLSNNIKEENCLEWNCEIDELEID